MQKLKTYHWQGINYEGMRVTGSNSCVNADALKVELKQQKISLLKYQRQWKITWKRQSSIKTQHILDFTRQLATLSQAGIPLISALMILSQNHENSSMKNLITVIKTDIESGYSLSETLTKHSRHFDSLYCNLIYASEQSGTLAIMLQQIADYQEKMFRFKTKIKKSLFYPVTVLSVALGVVATLLIFVIPQFETLFQGFGAKLPLYTLYVLKIAKIFQHFGWLLMGPVVLFAALKWYRTRSVTVATRLDHLLLKLPLLGPLVTKAIVARFARTLATTFNAGLPLTESMQVIAGSAGNLIYTQAILNIHDQVVRGRSIHEAMEAVDLFPKRVTQMIAIAEESATMTPMLQKIAEFYEQDIDNAADNLSKLLEPAIMLILGILVGSLIIAMYLPIFRLGNVI